MAASRFTIAAALVLSSHLAAIQPASAQAVREGGSFAAAGGWGTVRLPDAAYDPNTGVYLTVSGNLTHGRFVTQDGAPVGQHRAERTGRRRTDRGADLHRRLGDGLPG